MINVTLSFFPIFSLAINKSDLSHPQLSDFVHSVRIDNILIPMRDGIKLSTDLFFPDNANQKLPVILIRTPINKTGLGYMSYYFASQKVKDDTNLFHLPIKDIDLLITGKKATYFSQWAEHNSNDQ